MLSVTTGGTPDRFSQEGVYGPIGAILMPVEKLALEYMGFDVAPAYVAHGVPRSDDAGRKGHLASFSDAALTLANQTVTRTDAYRTALAAAPDAAWSRPS